MSSPAQRAYSECIALVERHQVTCERRDQITFILELREQLTRKLAALRGRENDDD